MTANNNNFILNMPRDSSHSVPDRGDLGINFRLDVSTMGALMTRVNAHRYLQVEPFSGWPFRSIS